MAHDRSTALQLHLSFMRLAVLALLCLVLAALLSVLPAAAQMGLPRPMTLAEVGTGTLLFETRTAGRYLPAPTVMTEVTMKIGGAVVRTTVRQRFHNPNKSWLEGVYAFPLPEDASVDHMRLVVGETAIEVHIRERAEARKTYEKARREGRRAALVEQHRPNLFTNAVANIAPGEAVTVELRYQHTARYDQGRFRLRFPMVELPLRAASSLDRPRYGIFR